MFECISAVRYKDEPQTVGTFAYVLLKSVGTVRVLLESGVIRCCGAGAVVS